VTNEQVEYIAKRVAEIAKSKQGEKVMITVIPPYSATMGQFDFSFIVSSAPINSTDGDATVSVRIA